MGDLARDGRWKHNWVPLDVAAAESKFHGRVPGKWSPPGGEPFPLGTHVRVKSGYHGGKEGHVVGGSATGVHVDLGNGHAVPLKKEYVEATGKAPRKVTAPKVEAEFKPKKDDRVTVGLREGTIREFRTFHGQHGAVVEFPLSEHMNKYGGEGYAPHWVPMSALKPPKTKRSDGLRLDELLARTAQTAEASTVHKPFGKPGGPGLWHTGKQLPAYIQSVAHHLVGQGHDESRAIEMAVGIVKNWAHGHDGHGHQVHPDVQAAAAKAIAEWEKLRAEAHTTKARRSTVTGASRAEMTASSINDLPDSAFAYIEPGGTKDASGKTVPRSLRHFPVHDEAHVRNALARAPQSPFGDKAMPKIKAAAKKLGVEVSDDSSSGGSASRRGALEYMRMYPLENIEILRSETSGPDGRPGCVVEAYAAVFDQPAEIQDHEGHYIEEIDRSAFDTAIAFAQRNTGGLPGNVKVLYNHGLTVQGTPAPEFQLPIGVPIDIKSETRGLLTRTKYHTDDPFAVRVLENIRAGAITAQSFVGRIIRSAPPLRPGERYRPDRAGELRTVRRMKLGLREYGPVLWPAYSGAEILGVRMSVTSTPGGVLDPDEDELNDEFAEDAMALPPDEGPAGGDPLPQEHSARYHQHALYALRSRELRERAGLNW